jgi:outer membrane biogenesis lipoprotein LolB
MRRVVALLTFACLSACSVTQSQQEHALVNRDDEWRQKQAVLDAEAILQGMAQARYRAQELARSAR